MSQNGHKDNSEKSLYTEKNISELVLDYLNKNAVVNINQTKKRGAVFKSPTLNLIYKNFKSKFVKALSYAYDIKYGNWDKVSDLRKLFPTKWDQPLKKIIPREIEQKKILIVGANDGREIKTIFTQNQLLKNEFYIVDISNIALGKCKERFKGMSNFHFFHADIQRLKLKKGYDMIIALRTVHCTSMNTKNCVKKLYKLSNPKSLTILSISNGYVNKAGEAVSGIFNFETNKIDREMPYNICEAITRTIKKIQGKSSTIKVEEGKSELFIYYIK